MYGLKQLSVLSFLLLSAYAAKDVTHTTVRQESHITIANDLRVR